MSSSRDDFGIAIRSALLQRGAKQKFSLVFLISLALLIFFLDYYSFKLTKVTRTIVNDVIYRVSNLATKPFHFANDISNLSFDIIFTFKQNKQLKEQLEVLKNKNFQVEYLTYQNENLRKDLEENKKIIGKSTIAKVLLDKDSPYLKSIIINRGSKSGIKKSMPVLDGNYLVGRVVEVNYLSSRVLLLNDLNSRIPVTLDSESSQAILTGVGKKDPILEYLPEQYNPEGDITVFTSGKDGIFIPGIPVGKTNVRGEDVNVNLFSDPNQLSFVTVQLIELEKGGLK